MCPRGRAYRTRKGGRRARARGEDDLQGDQLGDGKGVVIGSVEDRPRTTRRARVSSREVADQYQQALEEVGRADGGQGSVTEAALVSPYRVWHV